LYIEHLFEEIKKKTKKQKKKRLLGPVCQRYVYSCELGAQFMPTPPCVEILKNPNNFGIFAEAGNVPFPERG